MLQSNDPVWIDGKYDDNGKWMDGWESRRRRDGKDDFCFIRLGKKDLVSEPFPDADGPSMVIILSMPLHI